MATPTPDLTEKVTNLCLRRGIIFPASDAYGSFAGFYDYGPYGVELKNNFQALWWRHFVHQRDDVVGLDGSILANPLVWKASGHVDNFGDLLTECMKCHTRHRADHLIESATGMAVDGFSQERIQAILTEKKIVCPACKGALSPVTFFKLMFSTRVGATDDEKSVTYLRPETAQSIFAAFKILSQTSRKTLPFGVAQIGKAFRNEIAPRNFVFRCREFSQGEIEFFIHPDQLQNCPLLLPEDRARTAFVLTAANQDNQTAGQTLSIGDALEQKIIGTPWHAYWLSQALAFFESAGLRKENLRLRQHVKTELSHYSSETWDLEYNYPFGWKELCGIANRGAFDLTQHSKFSGKDLSVFDQASSKKVTPVVIEPSFGIDRALFTLLVDAYSEKTEGEGEKKETRVILKLHSSLAPFKAAVFPLMKKDGLAEKAEDVYKALKQKFLVDYDEAGSIGKRYARHDEIGTPLCVTIDYDTLQDNTVTVRERDTGEQKRVKIAELQSIVAASLE